jgi:hypothetical protein
VDTFFTVLVFYFREGFSVFRRIGCSPDDTINGVECQAIPDRVSGFLVPILLREVNQLTDGIFT